MYLALYDSRGDWPGCTTHHSQTAILCFTGSKSFFRILLGYFYNINCYMILSRPKFLHQTSLCNMSKYFSQIGNISKSMHVIWLSQKYQINIKQHAYKLKFWAVLQMINFETRHNCNRHQSSPLQCSRNICKIPRSATRTLNNAQYT